MFLEAVEKMHDLKTFYHHVSLGTWRWFFKPSFLDERRICARVFACVSGLVHMSEPAPHCPRCNVPMKVEVDRSVLFGWRYRCLARMSEAERRRRKVTSRLCRASVSAATNTWFDNCRDVGDALYLTFIWSCRVPVRQAIRDSGASERQPSTCIACAERSLRSS